MTLGTTNEVEEISRLPDDEQVSDDFDIYTDGDLFYAIRHRKKGTSFCLEHKNKWSLIALAVDIIHQSILNYVEPVKVPFELVLFYAQPQGNA